MRYDAGKERWGNALLHICSRIKKVKEKLLQICSILEWRF